MIACGADSDRITMIQSSDGFLFRLPTVNLKISLGSWKFDPTDNEVVQLPETSVILDLLFRFCYPERHPNLYNLDFDILAKLAEAVEKYKVFSAINVCKIAMRYGPCCSRVSFLIDGVSLETNFH
jgi:hypothetical protein